MRSSTSTALLITGITLGLSGMILFATWAVNVNPNTPPATSWALLTLAVLCGGGGLIMTGVGAIAKAVGLGNRESRA